MKTGLESSRVPVLGLRLCCRGDLNNTVSHFINKPPTPSYPAEPRGVQLQKQLNEIWFFKMSCTLESDGNLRCRNWKSQRCTCICSFPPDKHAILIFFLNRSYFMYLFFRFGYGGLVFARFCR